MLGKNFGRVGILLFLFESISGVVKMVYIVVFKNSFLIVIGGFDFYWSWGWSWG